VFALEMLKWVDTNYHYMVPEFLPTTEFTLSSTKVFDEFSEALALGIVTKPVLIGILFLIPIILSLSTLSTQYLFLSGPITFLSIGKAKQAFDKIATLLPKLVPLYVTVLQKLSALGAKYIQIDEPVLVKDLEPSVLDAFKYVNEARREEMESINMDIQDCLRTDCGRIGRNQHQTRPCHLLRRY
jgi:5-methyltetrahydropteroyltriglutamate--homocysteine methyltransferase